MPSRPHRFNVGHAISMARVKVDSARNFSVARRQRPHSVLYFRPPSISQPLSYYRRRKLSSERKNKRKRKGERIAVRDCERMGVAHFAVPSRDSRRRHSRARLQSAESNVPFSSKNCRPMPPKQQSAAFDFTYGAAQINFPLFPWPSTRRRPLAPIAR